MRSEIVAEMKRSKNGRLIPSGVGKHIRYYQSVNERDVPDKNCTLETLQESILKVERASGVPLTALKLSSEAFSLLANNADPPMTKTEISAALDLNVEVV